MVSVFRFAAVRLDNSKAGEIASVPYDVVSREEALSTIEQNPLTFLRVIRSDARCQGCAPGDEEVYRQAKRNFEDMLRSGLLLRDQTPGFYIYRVIRQDREFTGMVCCVSTRDYTNRRIRRHEETRYDKEEDRTRHIDTVNANTGLVFLLYRDPGGIHESIRSAGASAEQVADVTTEQGGARHQIFRITDEARVSAIEDLFRDVDALYIADGHHRAKSAVNVAERREASERFTEESGRFMAVLFAHNKVNIHGYSRLVTDLNGCTPPEFLERLRGCFAVEPYGPVNEEDYQITPKTKEDGPLHVMHMYLDGAWYEVTKPVEYGADLISSLDVAVLQDEVLDGMLGITDPRGDPRLHYTGGAKPLSDLRKAVDSGKYSVAFAMQPVSVGAVLSIADDGGVMPPKSTWFEPKLLSGLVVHTLE